MEGLVLLKNGVDVPLLVFTGGFPVPHPDWEDDK
jgi:hypothetical protein